MGIVDRALPLALTVLTGVIGGKFSVTISSDFLSLAFKNSCMNVGYYTFQPVFAPDAAKLDKPVEKPSQKYESHSKNYNMELLLNNHSL